MKSGVAMMLAAFLKANLEKAALPGDVIFCAVADEEAGGISAAGIWWMNTPGCLKMSNMPLASLVVLI